jgi:hypothetical protein
MYGPDVRPMAWCDHAIALCFFRTIVLDIDGLCISKTKAFGVFLLVKTRPCASASGLSSAYRLYGPQNPADAS